MIRSFLMTGCLLAAGAMVFGLFIPQHFTPSLIVLLLVVLLLSNLLFAIQIRSLREERHFIPAFMFTHVIKMLLFLALAIGWAWMEREYARSILISFLVMYLVFTLLEISELLRMLKRRNC